jgi:hypothetical protein
MTTYDAQIIAMQALTFLAGNDGALGRFLAETGLTGSDILAGAAQPEFQAGVLDFLLSNEGDLLSFCAEEGLEPDDAQRARALLPGGDTPHWT